VEITDEPTRYFTIAEVADVDILHIVEPNPDGTLEVYDITGISPVIILIKSSKH
jgi:hypothetical protein